MTTHGVATVGSCKKDLRPAGLTDGSVCPTLLREGLRFSGAGAFACQPVLSQFLTGRAALPILLLLLVSCVKPKPLSVLGQVAPFDLTDQTGQPFDSKTLAGHVWVADFIYTTCPGPCPMMCSQMHQVQIRTAETPDVKLVSFTVDPAHDSPPVLAAYSKHFLADPGRWRFLTGDQARLNNLGLNSFHLNSVDGSMSHSTRFVLVDRQMSIRGYYSTSEDNFMPQLLHDIRQLERGSS